MDRQSVQSSLPVQETSLLRTKLFSLLTVRITTVPLYATFTWNREKNAKEDHTIETHN